MKIGGEIFRYMGSELIHGIEIKISLIIEYLHLTNNSLTAMPLPGGEQYFVMGKQKCRIIV